MGIVLYSSGHAGDLIFNRSFLKQALAALPYVTLMCVSDFRYLWEDLDAPLFDLANNLPANEPTVNLWCGYDYHTLLRFGISYFGTVATYNIQAAKFGLHIFPMLERFKYVDMPEVEIPIRPKRPSVLVENGAVRSGQSIIEINPWLAEIETALPHTDFYCASPPPYQSDRLIDCSKWNLFQLSTLSRDCYAILNRLSGVNAATCIKENAGKRRIVAGTSLQYPVGDQDTTVYVSDAAGAISALSGV